mmetsp:Transcript_54877/g.101547  ORF Transcript_54877/g.101547 Transcript_54877/m.101547 type:complete len:216 (+) Transcript_54877:1122-1769(+)
MSGGCTSYSPARTPPAIRSSVVVRKKRKFGLPQRRVLCRGLPGGDLLSSEAPEMIDTPAGGAFRNALRVSCALPVESPSIEGVCLCTRGACILSSSTRSWCASCRAPLTISFVKWCKVASSVTASVCACLHLCITCSFLCASCWCSCASVCRACSMRKWLCNSKTADSSNRDFTTFLGASFFCFCNRLPSKPLAWFLSRPVSGALRAPSSGRLGR